ncbi:hypothetical protein F4V44_06010 [Niallia endozanthoxylica]|uniref:DUF2268 domain-containing protein n=2 Tax=Niallia endozanthoxylica TaxID=2036016 RepID=A0A5J5HX28_9BACI|nr:hypothetical protein F4V44_06010 [Niallia endozanthoxylica]
MTIMGIERTDEWLKNHFFNPLKICTQLRPSFKEKSESEIYQYLLFFGMYRPNRMNEEIYHELIKLNIWKQAEKILARYQKKWNGPDVSVYIFPFGKKRYPISDMQGGVSFKDGMFLFLSSFHKEDKALEALMVHEYHHVCRLNKSSKPIQDYTLLDSLIMEGLAEYAVTKYCGEAYKSNWVTCYSDEELHYYWEKDVKKHLQSKRMDPIHDAILFGKGRYPHLLGYALGHWLIENASKKRRYSIHDTFSIKSEELLD